MERRGRHRADKKHVQNILNSFQKDFDCGEDRDSDYIYGPTLPRSLFFGIKLNY